VRVEAQNLRKRFGRIEALRGLDFVIPSGQRVGLIGPNASGKSTLIRAILGLLRYEGKLTLDGSFKPGFELADRIMYVPQIAPKFGATVGDVVRAITGVRDIPTRRVSDCAASLGIALDELAKQPFRSLSGGAKQKTLIALALATDAALGVLDEPTASLDTASRSSFFRLLQERTPGATLILCSHRLEEIRSLVDHVMVLEEGRLRYHGPTDEYLDRITLSTVEVQVNGGQSDAVLRRLGFEPGVAGWWRRTATRPEKIALVEQIPIALKHDLVNLLVRDAEAVQLEQAPNDGGEP
jgi:ABC-2 type transport system ATP-binding protein